MSFMVSSPYWWMECTLTKSELHSFYICSLSLWMYFLYMDWSMYLIGYESDQAQAHCGWYRTIKSSRWLTSGNTRPSLPSPQSDLYSKVHSLLYTVSHQYHVMTPNCFPSVPRVTASVWRRRMRRKSSSSSSSPWRWSASHSSHRNGISHLSGPLPYNHIENICWILRKIAFYFTEWEWKLLFSWVAQPRVK